MVLEVFQKEGGRTGKNGRHPIDASEDNTHLLRKGSLISVISCCGEPPKAPFLAKQDQRTRHATTFGHHTAGLLISNSSPTCLRYNVTVS